MTSKERMLTALSKGKPDRLPVTIHQWQPYHLKHYMGGMSELEAFEATGMDAAVTHFTPAYLESPQWRVEKQLFVQSGANRRRYRITTPEGELTYLEGFDDRTTWIIEPLIKHDDDIHLVKKYHPIAKLDRTDVTRLYDEIGDRGILRMLIQGRQAGCWQDACCLVGTEEMILATFDKPDWVHELLQILLDIKLQYVDENLVGLPLDLVETGGGASSNTVISPQIHRDFCLPYDRKLHEAIHQAGHKVVYHTCGGMTKILDLIVANGCDASETLSPRAIGGDITDPAVVKRAIGARVCLIGGMDQFNILTDGSPEDIRKEVHRLFAALGEGGGYMLSASDHFFNTPMENLVAYAKAAHECVY